MPNSIETVWRLILDEQSAKKSENTVVKLSETAGKLGEEIDKITRSKQLDEMAKSWGKTALATGQAAEAAEAFNEQLQKIGVTEDEVKSLAKTFADVAREADKAGDSAGKVGGNAPAAGKFRGAASLIGGSGLGELVGIVDDLQDAGEGLKELAAAAGLITPAAEAAGLASTAAAPGLFASAAGFAAVLAPLLPLIIAIGAVVAILAVLKSADDQRAADLKREAELQRAISDEIAAGATTEDIQNQIALLNERSELEKRNLEENTRKYQEHIDSVRNAFGGLGRLLEPLVRLFGSVEGELAHQVDESQKLIDQNKEKEEGYNKALERGDTAKADAKKREEDLAVARDKAAEDAEKAADATQKTAEKEQSIREKAASDATKAVEQQAAKQEQAAQKQYAAAQKYGDAMVDIANKTADSAKAALDKQRQALADNQTSLQRDLAAISDDFAASEREQQIERMEQEAADLRQHASKINEIRDQAYVEETDLLRQRDFLGATKVRERANAEIEQQNKALVEAQQEKIQLQREADAKEIRELQDARGKRLAQFRQQNEDARQAYQRDLVAGREAKRIAERDAALARNRELKMASDTARAMLGIQSQFNQAQIQMAQNSLNQLRGVSNTTNNSRTINGGINMPIYAAPGSMSATAIQNQIYATLDGIGLTRP